MEKVYRSSKWWEVKEWGESVCELMIVKKTITRNSTQYSLDWVFVPFVRAVKFKFVSCVLLLVLSCLVCIVVVFLCVLLSSYVYLLYYVCIAVFTLDAGLLDRSQYSEGPVTGHLDTGFSWFPCV